MQVMLLPYQHVGTLLCARSSLLLGRWHDVSNHRGLSTLRDELATIGRCDDRRTSGNQNDAMLANIFRIDVFLGERKRHGLLFSARGDIFKTRK